MNDISPVKELRVRNISGAQHCLHCCGSGSKTGQGWVFVGWSGVGTDQMAPCPHCEAGYEVEYPERGKPPWGADGYWRGRSIDGLEETCQCGKLPLAPALARENLENLKQTIGAIGRQPT